MWGNWRTDIIPNVQYSERRVKKICRFLNMDSGTTMHANAWSEWASSNKGILQNRLPFNIRWDCDVPKKNNLGASVLINPKLCTLNPQKRTCTHLGSNLFKALQGFPCTYPLSLGFPPIKMHLFSCKVLQHRNLCAKFTQESTPFHLEHEKNCWMFVRKNSLKKQHLPPPATTCPFKEL